MFALRFGGSSAGQDVSQLAVLEGQLAWMVHIIAAVVKGRMSQVENQVRP